METDNSVLIDRAVQWMNVLNEDLQKRILERVSFVKKEVEDEQGVEEEQEVKKEPEVPPTTKVSISTHTDLPDEASQSGGSQQREVPASTASFHQREEAKEEKSINDDDTAPPVKESATLIWYGQDISGNEEDSILRELSGCFFFPMVKIQSGQVSTTKDFQHSQKTGICYGTRSIDRRTSHMT